MMSYACQHGIYGTCSYCRVEAEEAKEIQRTQAQARIQELEGLVRDMGITLTGLLPILIPRHQILVREILNPLVKSIMKAKP